MRSRLLSWCFQKRHCSLRSSSPESICGSQQPIDPSRLTIEKTQNPKVKLTQKDLVFGTSFSDHMLEINWDANIGWHTPHIHPFRDLSISPAASGLHYALQCFEGMKAYRDTHDRLRLFRPELNMERLNTSLKRLFMPMFDGPSLLCCLSELIKLDREWIPQGVGYSMYLRPTAISTHPLLGVGATQAIKLYCIMSPVGTYYPEGFNPIKLYADTVNVRAWPGGVGNTKLGGNYAPTIRPQIAAQELGCSQVLWLGEKETVTEVGAMNMFFFWVNEAGVEELVTAPLCRGDILPGVTRRSILELARSWGEFLVTERHVTMPEVAKASEEGRLREAFGAGTAVVVSPVKAILYQNAELTIIREGDSVGALTQRMWKAITRIQYGLVEHPWSHVIDE